VSESWNRHPIGLLAGNTYHMGVYDECVDVNYPVKGQYCLSEIHLFPPTGKNYSFHNGTENINDVGNNHAWKTILGVCSIKTIILDFHLGSPININKRHEQLLVY